MKIVLKSTFLFLLMMILSSTTGYTQQGNPFELDHRLKDKNLIYKEVESITPKPTENPFEKTSVNEVVDPEDKKEAKEVIEEEVIKEAVSEEDTTKVILEELPAKTKPTYSGNPFEKVSGAEVFSNPIGANRINNNRTSPQRIKVTTNESRIKQFVFISIMIMLLVTAVLSTFLRHFIFKTFESFKSDNLLRSNYRATGSTISFPYIFLEAFFVVNASLSLFLIMSKFNFGSGYYLKDFGYCLTLMILVVLGKHILLNIIAAIFPIKKDIKIYNFTISNFYIILGLVLVPINLFLAFAPEVFSNILLIITAILTLLTLFYLGFRGILIGSKYLAANRFHFFMYLCVVEIAPLFFVIKLAQNYIGF